MDDKILEKWPNSPRSLDSKLCVSLVMVALGITSTAGCEQPPRPVGSETVVPTYNAETGRLERISYDRDKDGKPDAWLYMDGTKATRAELDENSDGNVDRWEHYRADAATVDRRPRSSWRACSRQSSPRGLTAR